MTVNPITVYYCPGCTAAYATAAEAMACGGGGETRQPEPHVVWPCRQEDCQVWLHDSKEEAEQCATRMAKIKRSWDWGVILDSPNHIPKKWREAREKEAMLHDSEENAEQCAGEAQ